MFLLFRVNVFFSPRAFLVGVHSLFTLPYKQDLLDHLYKFSRREKNLQILFQNNTEKSCYI